MKSIRDIYKIGKGPSSSHTMGPAKAMSIYAKEHPEADEYTVVLYGSLADTGEGHGTDKAVESVAGKPVKIIFNKEVRELPHENTMDISGVKNGYASVVILTVGAWCEITAIIVRGLSLMRAFHKSFERGFKL